MALGRRRCLNLVRMCLYLDWDDREVKDSPTFPELRALFAALGGLACKGRTEVAVENPDLLVMTPLKIRMMARELEEAIAG